jgi:hypothetical protein
MCTHVNRMIEYKTRSRQVNINNEKHTRKKIGRALVKIKFEIHGEKKNTKHNRKKIGIY